MLKYDSATLVFGLTIDGLGMVQVQVPVEYAEDAEDLVAEDDGEDGDDSESEGGAAPVQADKG